jgi:hypothetical protein
MVDEQDHENPYLPVPSRPTSSPSDKAVGRRRIAGSAIGTVGFCVGAAPTIFICAILIAGWYNLATANPKPRSIRPMGLSVLAVMLSGVGLVVCGPIALVCGRAADRLGAKKAGELSRLGAALFLLPLILASLGIWLISVCTGVELSG